MNTDVSARNPFAPPGAVVADIAPGDAECALPNPSRYGRGSIDVLIQLTRGHLWVLCIYLVVAVTGLATGECLLPGQGGFQLPLKIIGTLISVLATLTAWYWRVLFLERVRDVRLAAIAVLSMLFGVWVTIGTWAALPPQIAWLHIGLELVFLLFTALCWWLCRDPLYGYTQQVKWLSLTYALFLMIVIAVAALLPRQIYALLGPRWGYTALVGLWYVPLLFGVVNLRWSLRLLAKIRQEIA